MARMARLVVPGYPHHVTQRGNRGQKTFLCRSAEEWPWSSARAHLARRNDSLVDVAPMLELIHDWRAYLEAEPSGRTLAALRKHSKSGRPLGNEGFLEELETVTGRKLRRKRRGHRKN